MAAKMLPYDEFVRIVNVMGLIPQKDEESQNAYFKRIIETAEIGRSRTTLQYVTYALDKSEGLDNKIDEAYNAYIELSRKRNRNKKQKNPKQSEQQKIDLDEVHDETKPEAVDNPTEEECIHHFKVARKATAICAIMMSCEYFSIENGVVNMRMPFHVFSNLADHYKWSDE